MNILFMIFQENLIEVICHLIFFENVRHCQKYFIENNKSPNSLLIHLEETFVFFSSL